VYIDTLFAATVNCVPFKNYNNVTFSYAILILRVFWKAVVDN